MSGLNTAVENYRAKPTFGLGGETVAAVRPHLHPYWVATLNYAEKSGFIVKSSTSRSALILADATATAMPPPSGVPLLAPANPTVVPGTISPAGPTNPMIQSSGIPTPNHPAAVFPGVGPAGLPAFVPPVSPGGVASGPLPSTPSPVGSAANGASMSHQQIEEMLDKLDERFANGEMSEQTYLMMRDKWQKRLASLP